MSSSAKSLYIAQQSIERFFVRNYDVYFWTFSEPGRAEGETMWTKDEAEAHFKPFRDLCQRRGVELLVVWERQKRGAWHPHCLVNRFIDVNKLRPWMMKRGWGQQMRVERVTWSQKASWIQSGGKNHCTGRFTPTWGGGGRLVRYLTKYLTKGWRGPAAEGAAKKKVFSGTARSKIGNTHFKWVPEIRPGAFLYAHGAALFRELFGRSPRFADVGTVIRLGVEETSWHEVDPLWSFGFG